jgi:hypothetical protein
LLDRAAPASELVNLQSLLEWQQTMLASRSLTELVARARYYPGAEGGPAAVSMLIADATHELRHLLIGSGESDAPASVSFVDSLYRLAPQLSAHAEPWVGTYRPADHGLLFGADPTLRHVAVYPLLARGALVGCEPAALAASSRRRRGRVCARETARPRAAAAHRRQRFGRRLAFACLLPG